MARTLEYDIGGGWVQAASLDSPLQITGLTNDQSYNVKLRVVDDGVPSAESDVLQGTPTGQLNSVSIDRANSGNNKVFVYYSVNGAYDTLEYRIGSGDWTAIAAATPLIIPVSNSAGPVFLALRASIGNTQVISNSYQVEANERPDYGFFIGLNKDLQSSAGNENVKYDQDGSSTSEVLISQESYAGYKLRPAWGGNIIVDHEGHLRCYYAQRIFQASGQGAGFGDYWRDMAFVIRSTDGGQSWSKPISNISGSQINHSESNMLVYRDHMGAVIDNHHGEHAVMYDPDAPLAERYKVVLKEVDGNNTLSIAVSQDGYDFTVQNQACITNIKADTVHSLFYDPDTTNKYVILGRRRGSGEYPTVDRRDVTYNASPAWDDNPWVEQDSVNDQNNKTNIVINSPDLWGYAGVAKDSAPLVKPDIYNAAMVKRGSQYVGLFSAYYRTDNRVPVGWGTVSGNHDLYRFDERPARTTGPIFPIVGWSEDAQAWTFPNKNKPFIDTGPYKRVSQAPYRTGSDSEEPQMYAGSRIAWVNNEMLFTSMVREDTHYEPWNGGDQDGSWEKDWYIILYRKVLDRFASWMPDVSSQQAVFRSSIMHIPDNGLADQDFKLNAEIESNGSVRVELLNALDGNPIDGYSAADCDPVSGGVYKTVTWGGKDLKPLRGQNVRVRYVFNEAKIFSWTFG